MKNESNGVLLWHQYIKNADSFSFYKKEKKKLFGERERRKEKERERESAYKT